MTNLRELRDEKAELERIRDELVRERDELRAQIEELRKIVGVEQKRKFPYWTILLVAGIYLVWKMRER